MIELNKVEYIHNKVNLYMRKNKFFLVLLLIFTFALKGLAIDAAYKHTLTDVNIREVSPNNYWVNVIFKDRYTEPLKLQKKGDYSYAVLLPETRLDPKKVKIVYEPIKENISAEVLGYPYLDNSVENGYSKIVIRTERKSNIKLLSNPSFVPAFDKIPKDSVVIMDTETATREQEAKKKKQEGEKEKKEQGAKQEIDPGQVKLFAPEGQQEVLKEEIAPPEPPPIDYFDVALKLSLLLFVLLVGGKPLYNLVIKIIKNKQAKDAKAQEPPIEESTSVQDNKTEFEDFNEQDFTQEVNFAEQLVQEEQPKKPAQEQAPVKQVEHRQIRPQQQVKQTEPQNQPVQQQVETIPPQPQPTEQQAKQVEPHQIQPQQTENMPVQPQPTVQQTASKDVISKASTQKIDDEEDDTDFDIDSEEETEKPLDPNAPKLVSNVKISNNKGFYLIRYGSIYSLIGYINDEIFVIKNFEKVYNHNLQTRLNERKHDRATYIVRVDNYKALIEVSETKMCTLIEF